MTAAKTFIEKHNGVSIYHDGECYIASIGLRYHFDRDDLADIRDDIDGHYADEREFYRDQDTPADTPSLDAPWWECR